MKQLPSSNRGIFIYSRIYEEWRWDRLSSMMYLPSFIKLCSGIRKLIRGIQRHRNNMVITKEQNHSLTVRAQEEQNKMQSNKCRDTAHTRIFSYMLHRSQLMDSMLITVLDTTCAVLFREMVSISYWNLIKIATATLKNTATLCWGSCEGSLYLELECLYSPS
jgi:hypothetical protein